MYKFNSGWRQYAQNGSVCLGTRVGRRRFLKLSGAALLFNLAPPYNRQAKAAAANPLFWIVNIPSPTLPWLPNALIAMPASTPSCAVVGGNGLKFYRSDRHHWPFWSFGPDCPG